jgi:hypothetical protein
MPLAVASPGLEAPHLAVDTEVDQPRDATVSKTKESIAPLHPARVFRHAADRRSDQRHSQPAGQINRSMIIENAETIRDEIHVTSRSHTQHIDGRIVQDRGPRKSPACAHASSQDVQFFRIE